MTITNVIIPVDFSEVSIGALDCGRWVAARAHVSAELLAVTTPRYANVTEAALRSLAADHTNDHTPLRNRVITTDDDDDVEGVLVREALANEGSLWCVGSHGRTALGEFLFGSVSADLIRNAEVPIVVVGPHAEIRPNGEVLAVALDGSDLAETILPAAVRIAADLGLRLRLLQVGTGPVPDDANDTAYLAGVARTLPHPEHADYDTLHGNADDELIGYVERTDDVAMLAMATRGGGAGARLKAPSTAMKVLRRAVVPVLVLHPAEPEPPAVDTTGEVPLLDLRQRVVVGIDTHEASRPALEWAADEADRRGAILQVVHSWTLPVAPGSMYGYPIWPDIEGCRSAALDEVAATAATVAERHPALTIETIVAEGSPIQVIEEVARGAQLVVLGKHRHGRLATLLIGSTSASAVHHVDCPLVIVPCDEPEPGE